MSQAFLDAVAANKDNKNKLGNKPKTPKEPNLNDVDLSSIGKDETTGNVQIDLADDDEEEEDPVDGGEGDAEEDPVDGEEGGEEENEE